MGHGVVKQDVLKFVDECTNLEEDDRQKIEVTEKTFRGLQSRHKDLLKIVSAGSLDPQRAKKANSETRDKVFAKLDACIRNLFSQGLVPWKCAAEVPGFRLCTVQHR